MFETSIHAEYEKLSIQLRKNFPEYTYSLKHRSYEKFPFNLNLQGHIHIL